MSAEPISFLDGYARRRFVQLVAGAGVTLDQCERLDAYVREHIEWVQSLPPWKRNKALDEQPDIQKIARKTKVPAPIVDEYVRFLGVCAAALEDAKKSLH